MRGKTKKPLKYRVITPDEPPSPEELCYALTGLSIENYAKVIKKNENGKYDRLFERSTCNDN